VEVGLAGPRPAAWAVNALKNAPDQLLQAIISRFMSSKSPEELLRKLQALVPDPESYPILFRLLKNGLVVPPDVFCSFLDTVGDAQTKLSRVWLQGDHVETVLVSTAAFKDRAEPVWQRFCQFLSKDLMMGDATKKAFFDHLLNARNQCKGNTPPASAQLLDDWAVLLKLFNDPQTISASRKEIQGICERRLPKADEVLKEYFLKVVQPKVVDPPQMDHLQMASFVETFEKVFPAEDVYPEQLERFDSWLKVVDGSKNSSRFHFYYLTNRVPLAFRLHIARDREAAIGKKVYDAVAKVAKQQKAQESNGPALVPVPNAAAANETANSDKPRDVAKGYRVMTMLAVAGLVVGTLLILVLGCGYIISQRKELEEFDALKQKVSGLEATEKSLRTASAASEKLLTEKEAQIAALTKNKTGLNVLLEARQVEIDASKKREEELLKQMKELENTLKGEIKRLENLLKAQTKSVGGDKSSENGKTPPKPPGEGDLFISDKDFEKKGSRIPDDRFPGDNKFPDTATLSLDLSEEQKKHFTWKEANKGQELRISIRISGEENKANKFKPFFTIKLVALNAERSKLVLESNTTRNEIPDATMKYLENNKLLLKIINNKKDELKCWLAWKAPKK
jgi:hypothetical protein